MKIHCLAWLIAYHIMSDSATDTEMGIFLSLFVFTVVTDVELLKNTSQIYFHHYKK